MAVARVKTWASGDTLTAADLNAEFNNILNNGTSVAFPLTADQQAAGFDITEIDELGFATTAATVASAIGRLRRNGANITWHDGTGGQSLMLLGSNYIGGLEIRNATTDAINDIIVTAGVATDATNTSLIRLTAALDKQVDAAWAVGAATGGLDTGSVNNTTIITYHLHVIKRPDTGVVDALFSTSPSAPVMPTNYTLRRRVGSIIRQTTFYPFIQMDDQFHLSTMIGELNGANTTTTQVPLTLLGTPNGINVLQDGVLRVVASSAAAIVLVSDMDETDQTPATTICTSFVPTAAGNATTTYRVRTSTSTQIRVRRNTTGAGEVTQINTRGWIDVRGKNGGL